MTLDHETQSSYAVIVQVSDGEDGDGQRGADGERGRHGGGDDHGDERGGAAGRADGLTVGGATATSLTVSWTAPADSGAVAVTDYDVRWYAGAERTRTADADWVEAGEAGGHDHTGTGHDGDDHRAAGRHGLPGAGACLRRRRGRVVGVGGRHDRGVGVAGGGLGRRRRHLAQRRQAIEVTATFGESVTVSGTPRIAFTLGTETKHLSYASGSPGTALVFSYTVASGDEDSRRHRDCGRRAGQPRRQHDHADGGRLDGGGRWTTRRWRRARATG